MTCIGTFAATPDGFEGRLQTLTIDAPLTLVAADPGDTENAPDYRIMAGEGEESYEVGAGWKHVGDKAGSFVTLVIDDPVLPRPLRANLFSSDDQNHVLIWSRGARRPAKG